MKERNNKSIKSIISEIIEIAEPGSGYEKYSRIFDIFIISLIVVNVLSVVLGSVKSFHEQFSSILYYLELISVIIFSIEYVLRLITCTELGRYKKSKEDEDVKNTFSVNFKARILYAVSPFATIDLLAILPFYLPMVISFDLRFIRIFRLFRILRLLKAGRYSRSIRTLGKVVQQKKMELLTTIFVMILLLTAASSFMYYVENPVQPDKFSSIPAAMWWGVATLTTVGYGDIYPVTLWGKFFAGIIAILGIGIVALPSGILASGLIEEFQNLKEGYVEKEVFEGHILICGWNYLGTDILDKLLSEDARNAGINQTLIMANIQKPQLELMKYSDKEIYFVMANPLNEVNLIDKGAIDNCKSVLILPEFSSTKSDAESLMILLAIKKRSNETGKNIFTCVQVLDSSYRDHFVKGGADEIVCMDDFGSGITVGSIITHGLTKVVNELVDYNEGSEIYKSIEMPEKYSGKTFKALVNIFLEHNVILIAIETKVMTEDGKERTVTNVKPDKDFIVPDGSSLFFIAENKSMVDKLFI